MKTNWHDSSTAATLSLEPGSTPQCPARTSARGTRQVAFKAAARRSAARPGSNRAYLKALRQAELAAWEAASHPMVSTEASPSTPVRLPVPARHPGESRVLIALGVLGGVTLAQQLWTTLHLANGWHDFVRYVQQLVS